VLSMFFYTIGHLIKIPLLDPENNAYRERIDVLASYISGIAGKWETYCYPVMTKDQSLPRQLAYSLRKLAEMLSYSELTRIAEQDFYRKAFYLAENRDKEDLNTAMMLLCSGLATIQARLDLGLSPFDKIPVGHGGNPESAGKERMTHQKRSFCILK